MNAVRMQIKMILSKSHANVNKGAHFSFLLISTHQTVMEILQKLNPSDEVAWNPVRHLAANHPQLPAVRGEDK